MIRLIGLIAVILTAIAAQATTIHVPSDQPTIQAGIDAAVDGDTVLVAPGNYAEHIVFGATSVVLRSSGGGESTFITESSGGIVFPNGVGNSSSVIGFTIRNAVGYSGISIGTGNSPSVVSCLLKDNTGASNGGGIDCESEWVTIRGCRFEGNTGGEGGGLAIDYAESITIDSCVFVGNSGGSGGGIYVRTSTDVVISRCLGWRNTATGGTGGGFLYACNMSNNVTILNCTIVDNNAPSSDRGAGVELYHCTNADVRNNIIAFNKGSVGVYVNGDISGLALEYNDVYGNPSGDYWGTSPGTGSISADPLLADTAMADFRLLAGSPCIDSGDPAPEYNDPDGSRADIGALGPSRVPGVIRVPSEYPTIQAGIDYAIDGDTVLVADGTYTGDGNRDVLLGDRSLVVMSESGPELTIIDCQATELDQHGGFTVESSNSSYTTLKGLTVTGAYGEYGTRGAIFATGGWSDESYLTIDSCIVTSNSGGSACAFLTEASVLLRHCIIRQNSLTDPAIRIEDGPLEMNNCLVSENAGGGCAVSASPAIVDSCSFVHNGGDGLYLRYPDAIVTNCVFSGNTTGIESWGDDGVFFMTVRHCQFLDNGPTEQGAGMMFWFEPFGGDVHIDSCLFANNVATYGGAVWADVGMPHPPWDLFSACRFVGNEALEGGALYIAGADDVSISDCVFKDNSSQEGGAVYISQLSSFYTDFVNCTFSANTAPIGSHLRVPTGSYGDPIDMEGCIMAGGLIGPAIECSDLSAAPALTCMDIFANEGGDWVGGIADQAGINGNLSIDPLFCDTANDDYTLFDFSQCAAANNSCGELIGAFDVGCALTSELAVTGEVSTINVINHTPTLEWSYLPEEPFTQSAFEIEVGTDDDWSAAEMWQAGVILSGAPSTTYAGNPLSDGATYFARIRLLLNGTWTYWQGTSFRMNSLPTEPQVASPPNGGTAGFIPTLYVHNAADAESDPLAYEFEVYSEPELTGLVEASGLVSEAADSTGWTMTSVLADNSLYFWRCRTWDGYEYSDWSLPWFFAVDAIPEPPLAPEVVAPVGEGLILFEMLPTFEWTEVSDPDPFDAVHYRLELAVDPGFTYVNVIDDLTEPTYQLTDSLAFDAHYWWRVLAVDNTDLSTSSDTADFQTWSGPCCDGRVGDANGLGGDEPTIGDASVMIDAKFIAGTCDGVLPCLTEADVNQSGGTDPDCADITIGDISTLIDYLFITGPSLGLAECL